MRASLGLLFALVVGAVGCRSTQAVGDPFINSRIPPPQLVRSGQRRQVSMAAHLLR